MKLKNYLKRLLSVNIEIGKSVNNSKENSIIFFPYSPNTLNCGISALVAYKGNDNKIDPEKLKQLEDLVATIKKNPIDADSGKNIILKKAKYLGGDATLTKLLKNAHALRQNNHFLAIYYDKSLEKRIKKTVKTLSGIVESEKQAFKQSMAKLPHEDVKIVSERIEKLQDTLWCLEKEILNNLVKIKKLTSGLSEPKSNKTIQIFRQINAVLNSIDRLEVRGRDSAGVSLIFTFTKLEFEKFRASLVEEGLSDRLKQRTNNKVLKNNCITIQDSYPAEDQHLVTISIVYKTASEIGALGDNIKFIRTQVKNDRLLHLISCHNFIFHTISSHTRWASVGDITEANCHPVDNTPAYTSPGDKQTGKSGIIHVSLNGDIDNYLELKKEYEARYDLIQPEITTDTKLIPLQIEHYLKQGNDIEESFRLAVNDFEGSHAISMHTNLAPDKLFLAQKGSGQAIFVGIAPDHYIAASELYGIIEETQSFIKLQGQDKGQIVALSQNSSGSISDINSFFYDKSPILLKESDLQKSNISSRDIDRQGFPHYFLKEISEAPGSVEKTLENKWKTTNSSTDSSENGPDIYKIVLDESVIPKPLSKAFKTKKIKKIYFIGQGTAGVAAQGCADLLKYYLSDLNIEIKALKSSELSGFAISDQRSKDIMKNDLVVGTSQSGTTTDTNRTIDMVKSCGAHTLCIVNRRDSDITFKTDGVLYTSSGRDIEMSVASTKAFYSQIAAGSILGLYIATICKTQTDQFITQEINELATLPLKMKKILGMKDEIKESASRIAVTKDSWAVVGSGSNKTSADEIRIKLSELCYKTISSDFIEDKKHIDLSAEPLIIICAAGTRENVLADIIKDTAIFNAHKATPVVITQEGEDRFDLYSESVFKIPKTKEHFAPVLNTLVGHLWGYYAALAINESSSFICSSRLAIKEVFDEFINKGNDIYEVILENKFREKITQFYYEFSKKRKENKFPGILGLNTVTNITLLSKYLSGRLPVSDFEIDFQGKGTPANMLDAFFKNLGDAVNIMARPVDAIKHQAKTVTVGTSRIVEKFEGVVFDELSNHGLTISQLTNKNVVVLKNIQEVLSKIRGSFLYKISGLDLLGNPTSDTKIEVIRKQGSIENETSRVEKDTRLKGTKNIIVREGNVYLGKGRKDARKILVIPIFSSSSLTPNKIENILSLEIDFKKDNEVTLLKKIKGLGGKFSRIKDLILESATFKWDDKLLNLVSVEELFGDPAEVTAESIIKKYK
jgi:glucosamine--fructose-6-phosphate aminotransferase (isomerizing)